ncbi:MAG: PVC-type heme-binding CxxCH protein [Planctomycetota bacterium]
MPSEDRTRLTSLLQPMSRSVILVIAWLSVGNIARTQDAAGIKNLKGANLDLMQNHDPESERVNFELLDGYEVSLFASEPMFANPVHMHWDSRGRLWVACSWAYPQLKPGEKANDKIIILEDTDDDGVADKSTVFADGLYLPTGLELANGGCYVAQSPDVFFLKDTDGDDVADVKELALTGFGIEDSHHSISAWRRGPGGWIYFQEGIFLHSQVETQYGVVRNFNGGVYQFNPRTQELRVFCRGTGGNPWGHVFDDWGQSFMVNNPRIMYLSSASGNSGETVRIKPLISTEKQCGGDLATGSHVGDDIRGNLLSGRFKSRAVIRYELIDQGAGFSANVLEPLMTSKHPNFRPVDVKVGPDGAIYVADWYNSIINHAQHDFRDPRRDHDHGRIWRITHKTRPLVEQPALHGAAIVALIEQLKSSEAWTRHQARKELSERDPDQVFSAVESWVDQLNPEDARYDHHLVEAMWACQNVERVSEKILKRVLDCDDGHARSAGARVIRYWHAQLTDPIKLVAKACRDPYPRTRMEAVLSAGFIPTAEAYAAALHSIDHPGDAFLDQALPQTRKALETYWRPELEAGTLRFQKQSHRAFAEKEAGMRFGARLASFLGQTSPTKKDIDNICQQLKSQGTEEDLLQVVAWLSDPSTSSSSAVSIALLETLRELSRSERSPAVTRSMSRLRRLVTSENQSVAVLAVENLGAWKVPKASGVLTDVLRDLGGSQSLRRAAGVALGRLGERRALETLEGLALNANLEVRYAAISGLTVADASRGIPLAARLLAEDPTTLDPVTLVRTMLGQQGGLALFEHAIKDVSIHPSVKAKVDAFHRQSGILPPGLADSFSPDSSPKSLSMSLLGEDQEQLALDVDALGDPVRGETIYRRKALACTNCHAIGAAGSNIGPNLVAVGAAAKTGYIVESILEPSKAIAEHYDNRSFLLDDGSVQTGIVTFKSDDEIIVRDAALAGKEIRLATDEILAEQDLPSAMPASLADQLTSRQEFLDLAKFVSSLGKPGPYANDERPVIRKWRIASRATNGSLPSENADWLPAYSKVNGELPSEDLPQHDRVFVRGYVSVQVAGRGAFAFNGDAGLQIWLDGREVRANQPTDLLAGRHSLTVAIDRKERSDLGLRVELVSSPSSTLKWKPEGGI